MCAHLDNVDDAVLDTPGWLEGSWPPEQLRALLRLALDQRSVGGLKLAAGSGACAALFAQHVPPASYLPLVFARLAHNSANPCAAHSPAAALAREHRARALALP